LGTDAARPTVKLPSPLTVAPARRSSAMLPPSLKILGMARPTPGIGALKSSCVALKLFCLPGALAPALTAVSTSTLAARSRGEASSVSVMGMK
jgi:hypothetical protein